MNYSAGEQYHIRAKVTVPGEFIAAREIVARDQLREHLIDFILENRVKRTDGEQSTDYVLDVYVLTPEELDTLLAGARA